MKQHKQGTQKGAKNPKVRSHVALTAALHSAVSWMGEQTFGTKTGYLEHLILKDLERQNLTVPDILSLAEQWASRKAA